MILEKGRHLYQLEKASWFATDILLESYPHKLNQVVGYLSYKDSLNEIHSIFFGGVSQDSIILRINFGMSPSEEPISLDSLNHKVNLKEKALIGIRSDAQERIYSRKDTLYTFYNNTSLNLIPIISEYEQSVYVLTGPRVSNLVLIGNDYKLSYNKQNEYQSVIKIHNSLLQYPYKSKETDPPLETTFHSHVNSEVINETDICTLLLYKDYIEWKSHYVMSENYVSIFNIEEEELVILTKKAWDKINAHQKSKSDN